MSSAQVLPSSRKQEHLAAGKRRLEEFRKKKGADRPKKTNEKQPTFTQVAQRTDSHGSSAQTVPDEAIVHHLIAENSGLPYKFEQKKEQDPVADAHSDFPSNSDRFSQSTTNSNAIERECKKYDDSGSSGSLDHSYDQENKELNVGGSGFSSVTYNQENNTVVKGDSGIPSASPISYGFTSDRPTFLSFEAFDATDSSSSQSSNLAVEVFQAKESKSNLKDSLFTSPSSSLDVIAKTSPQNFGSFLYTKLSNASTTSNAHPDLSPTGDALQPVGTTSFAFERMHIGKVGDFNKSDLEERSIDKSGVLDAVQSAASYTSEYSSTDLSSPSNHASLYTSVSETRRSRPSFLDSLNVPRVSPPIPVREKFIGNGPGVGGANPVDLSTFGTQFTHNFSSLVNNGHSLVDANDRIERKPDFHLPNKQDEDFAALEQHIEDLTQEKFSLQRALEASRALAESLATENSSLTDSYNQQRSAVNQLKADMEKLQEEISLQLAELEAIRNEYSNAKLECNAADERAKLLAAEVIGLEEKALRLRSNELKLERQLENTYEEFASYKKKVGSLEKERMDFQSTISALQEEKKVLQAKLRKASASGKLVDISKKSTNKKDISTSTEDLGASVDTSDQQTQQSRSLVGNEASSSTLLLDNVPINLEASFVQIPPDEMRTIENINILISELALEKEELVKRLASETSESSRLKESNKELLRRLEVQTQRLELLTAQSMANANMPAKVPETNTVYDSSSNVYDSSSNVYDNTAYADEGDEVVERVLGWIMKLFPGGPSRRRTSKLL